MEKNKISLTLDTIKVIEQILSDGNKARVATSKDGITIHAEKMKKMHTQSQPQVDG